MKKIFFTPGPTQIYPTLFKYLQEGLENDILSVSHRSNQFKKIYKQTVLGLKKLLNVPDEYEIFFLSSATEAMERIIENCVLENSFHFVNGAFSDRFYKICKQLNKKPQKYEVKMGEGFDFDQVKISKTTELICFTHNESSTGVMISMNDIYKLKKKHLKALIAVDVVSSIPYGSINFKFIDCLFFSVQKGFGLPAGLGVLILSPKAIQKSKRMAEDKRSIGSYHSFVSLNHNAKKYQTPETPNVLGIYLLGKVINDMRKKGLAVIQKETEIKSNLLYNFFDQNVKYSPFVKDKAIRSKTIIPIDVFGGSEKIIKSLSNYGIIVGSGYKIFKKSQIRIANYMAHSIQEVEKLLERLKKI